MARVIIRGRAAWFAGLVLGVILLILGLSTGMTWAIWAGVAFLVISGAMLIISYATRGRLD